jgi:hypothetical protein
MLFIELAGNIVDGFGTVTKTYYPPVTKVECEGDNRRDWEEFARRYGEGADLQVEVKSRPNQISKQSPLQGKE